MSKNKSSDRRRRARRAIRRYRWPAGVALVLASAQWGNIAINLVTINVNR